MVNLEHKGFQNPPFEPRLDVMLFLRFIYVLLKSRPDDQMSRPDA
jgi:hypothetical protein